MFIIGYILLLIGAVFIFLGILGVFRMPDLFNKLQAGTKATTLGFISLVAGMIFIHPEWWGKLLLVGFFVLLTNPIGSHNLARSAHSNREEMVIHGEDALSEKEEA